MTVRELNPAGASLDYWRCSLAGMPEYLELPVDRPRPAHPSYRAGTVSTRVERGLHRGLADLAGQTRSSVFMAVQALLGGLLTRLGADTDVPIGCVVAGSEDAENLAGLSDNLLVLRTDTSGDPGFRALLERVRDADCDAFAHCEVPFEQVVDVIAPSRSAARHPLFQVLLASREIEPSPDDAGEPDAWADQPFKGTTRFDLSVSFGQRSDPDGQPSGLDLSIEYACDLFDHRTVERIAEYFRQLLGSAVASPDQPMSQFELISQQERYQLLEGWNDTAVAVERASLPDLLNRQAGLTPEAIAVRYEQQSLTYRELAAQSNRLARLLISRGAGPESVVAIRVPRSLDLIVVMLAVIKTGAAYLPLDLSYPAERIAYMLGDSRPICVLTDAGGVEETPGQWPQLVVDDPETRQLLDGLPATDLTDDERTQPLRPAHPAYVLYTSGSTGRPKGVVMPGSAIVNLLAWHTRTMAGGVGRTTAQFASLGFDVATQEILSALTSGKTIAVPSEDCRKDVAQLGSWLHKLQVNELFAPNPVLEALAETAQQLDLALPHLVQVVQAGEAITLSPALRRFFAPSTGRQLYNNYGPTETHVVTGCLVPDEYLIERDSPPIGSPTWNTRAYVLDERLRAVPHGVAGELYLAGDQLARGYLNRCDLTAERFVADPFGQPGSRMYRSGDLVRRLSDGTLGFLGRTDFQVKLRGFRLELGEVEAVLAAQPGVNRVIALVREDRPGDRRLVAYVVGAEHAPLDPSQLRQSAARQLPDYMVPAAVVVLPSFPLTPNNKVDRAALPAPVYAGGGDGPGPATEREARLCAMFAEVLGVNQVGPVDDFFALGGHSLLATRLVSRIRAELDCEVEIRDLFDDATARGVAACLRPSVPRPAATAGTAHAADMSGTLTPGTLTPGTVLPGTGARHYPMTFEQESMWLEDQLAEGDSALLESWVYRLRGAVDPAAVEWALTELVRRQEALRTRLIIDGDTLVQAVDPEPDVVLHQRSCTEEALAAELKRAVTVALDPEEPPLRATLFTLAADHFVLAVELHHTAIDDWSFSVMDREFGELYRARVQGRPAELEQLSGQIGDFAVGQRTGGIDPVLLDWWQDSLAGAAELDWLPLDRPRPAEPRHTGGRIEVTLPAELTLAVRRLSQSMRTTPFTVFAAALTTLLYRDSGQTDVIFGVPVSRRGAAELDSVVGCLTTLLPLRQTVRAGDSFGALVAATKRLTAEVMSRRDTPLPAVLRALGRSTDLGAATLCQLALVVDDVPRIALDLPQVEATRLYPETGMSKFDATLFLISEPAGYRGFLEYSDELFDRPTVERIADDFLMLVGAAVAAPDQSVAELARTGVGADVELTAAGGSSVSQDGS